MRKLPKALALFQTIVDQNSRLCFAANPRAKAPGYNIFDKPAKAGSVENRV